MVTDRDKMIENNIGLVHSIANRFKGRGVDYDDLFQSGCVGLIKAVDNFDESRGFAFSTYAVPVIMGEIKRIFRDGGAVKVSRSLKEKAIKAQSLREKFINDKKWMTEKFNWQEGYGAFSYSKSNVDLVVKYILNQEEHHKNKSFKNEYLEFLEKFEIEYDSKYLFEWIENN